MSRGKKILLILIAILVLLGLLGATAYYLGYFDKYLKQEPVPAKTSQEPQVTEFSGSYIAAEIPAGWTIVEYQNGAGTTMVVAGSTYAGLTGMEIKNPSGTVVFSLAGVWGIGGLDVCQSYPQFSDHSPAYLAQLQANNAEVGEPAPAVLDLATTAYQEYNLFGIRVRRVGTTLYWDKVNSDAYFQPACGLSGGIFRFAGLSFTGDETPIYDYKFIINQTSPESELEELDSILQSLTAIAP